MKVCPNNALHPAFSEAGWEGIWTPVLVPRVGYCEPVAHSAGQVCPTGALGSLLHRRKAGRGLRQTTGRSVLVRLSTTVADVLPWAMATDCIVCEEWCPTSPKAVYLQSAEVTDSTGNTKQVRQPYIDPARCVGCGACEYVCPVRDRPGGLCDQRRREPVEDQPDPAETSNQTYVMASRRVAKRRDG